MYDKTAVEMRALCEENHFKFFSDTLRILIRVVVLCGFKYRRGKTGS